MLRALSSYTIKNSRNFSSVNAKVVLPAEYTTAEAIDDNYLTNHPASVLKFVDLTRLLTNIYISAVTPTIFSFHRYKVNDSAPSYAVELPSEYTSAKAVFDACGNPSSVLKSVFLYLLKLF